MEAPDRSEELTDDEPAGAESAVNSDVAAADDEDDHDGGGNRVVGVAKSVGSGIGDGIGRATRSARTAGVVAGVSDWLNATRRERKLGKGTMRSTYVVAYRGYVADGRAHVRVRVMEEPVIPPPAEAITDTTALKANLRRFAALSFPGVKLRLSQGKAYDEVESGRHGYATTQLPVGELKPGWHDYEVVTQPDDPDEEPTKATGQVLMPDPKSRLAVISDLDDTVLKTGLSEGLVAVRRTLFGQAQTRHPIPGMATLYRAIEAGKPGNGRASFFYLSTGPWNLYDMLTEFLELRGFPAGPLFLTDWGPQERYVTRSGREHKRKALRRLFDLYPDMSFVLVGDSGQRDPDVYTEIARDQPGRVRAIVIIDAGEHAAERGEELLEAAPELREQGIPFVFVKDAREAAGRLEVMGLIAPAAVSSVALAYERGIAAEG